MHSNLTILAGLLIFACLVIVVLGVLLYQAYQECAEFQARARSAHRACRERNNILRMVEDALLHAGVTHEVSRTLRRMVQYGELLDLLLSYRRGFEERARQLQLEELFGEQVEPAGPPLVWAAIHQDYTGLLFKERSAADQYASEEEHFAPTQIPPVVVALFAATPDSERAISLLRECVDAKPGDVRPFARARRFLDRLSITAGRREAALPGVG